MVVMSMLMVVNKNMMSRFANGVDEVVDEDDNGGHHHRHHHRHYRPHAILNQALKMEIRRP